MCVRGWNNTLRNIRRLQYYRTGNACSFINSLDYGDAATEHGKDHASVEVCTLWVLVVTYIITQHIKIVYGFMNAIKKHIIYDEAQSTSI